VLDLLAPPILAPRERDLAHAIITISMTVHLRYQSTPINLMHSQVSLYVVIKSKRQGSLVGCTRACLPLAQG
jgi:hypothetical protein